MIRWAGRLVVPYGPAHLRGALTLLPAGARRADDGTAPAPPLTRTS